MRRLLLVGSALVLALATATACGDDESGGIASAGEATQDASADQPPASEQDQAQKFVDCMREHGVDLPDPDPNAEGIGVDPGSIDREDPAVQEALQACRSELPAGEAADPDPAQLEQMQAFAECMREHGIDMPDPDPDGTFGQELLEQIDTNDPEFQAAFEACQEHLAGLRGGGQ